MTSEAVFIPGRRACGFGFAPHGNVLPVFLFAWRKATDLIWPTAPVIS